MYSHLYYSKLTLINDFIPLPLYSQLTKVKKGTLVIIIIVGILAGIGAGIRGLLNSIFMTQRLSLEVTQQIIDTVNKTNTLQEQTTSLAGVVLHNRWALDLLMANQEGPVLHLMRIVVFH